MCESPSDPVSARPTLVVLASRSSSVERGAMSRNLERVVRQRITRITQVEVAKTARIEKTAINRIVAKERGVMIDELFDFTAALGLAVIECEGEVVSLPASELEALSLLARDAVERKAANAVGDEVTLPADEYRAYLALARKALREV